MCEFQEDEVIYHLESGSEMGAGIVPATITGCDILIWYSDKMKQRRGGAVV